MSDSALVQKCSNICRGSTMYALIAIGAVVALFAILNIIDFKRLD